ncbi:hypothetical protein CKO51_06905 [Rhodopirellula sp. SM50]|nr:hypothetical protein CKO51_06905 [Rhodopirellula sp. SM50]
MIQSDHTWDQPPAANQNASLVVQGKRSRSKYPEGISASLSGGQRSATSGEPVADSDRPRRATL